MTAQQAMKSDLSPAQALAARTAWLGRQNEPLKSAGTVIEVPEGQEICAEGQETESFYKVLSGVVRVRTEIPNPDGTLKPKMTGYAKIKIEHRPVWDVLFRPFLRWLRIEVWSWLP